jgi:hypothetical protein
MHKSFLNCSASKAVASKIDARTEETQIEMLRENRTSEFSHSLGYFRVGMPSERRARAGLPAAAAYALIGYGTPLTDNPDRSKPCGGLY